MKGLLIISFALFCASFSLRAQENFQFKNFSINQGLSQSSVTDICEDALGNIWLGTWDGLNKFDGEEFKIFRNNRTENKFKSSKVLKLFADQNNHLFIYTVSGLQVLNLKSENLFYHKIFEQYRFSTPVKYNDSLMLFSEPNKGLYFFNAFTYNVQSCFPKIKDICSKNNIVYLLNSYDNIVVVFENGLIVRASHNQQQIDSIRIPSVLSCGRWFQNEFYCGTIMDGIAKVNWDKRTFHFLKTPNDRTNIVSILEVNQQLYGFSYGDGLLELDGTKTTLVQHDRMNFMYNYMLSAFVDRHNNLWIGTDGEGVLVDDKLNQKFQNISNNRLGSVRAIVEDSHNDLIVATYSNGLFKYNNAKEEIVKLNYKERNNPNAIYLNGDLLWIGTDRKGIDIFSLSQNKVIRHLPIFNKGILTNAVVYKIEKFSEKLIAVCTKDLGLLLFDKDHYNVIAQVEPKYLNISSNAIRNICIKDSNYAYLGLENGGIAVLNKNNLQIEKRIVSLPGNTKKLSVKHIWVDKHSNNWVSTDGDGLLVFDKDWRLLVQWNTNTSILPNDVVYASLFHEGDESVWLSTNLGLCRVKIKYNTRNIPLVATHLAFDVSNGLQSNEFNSGAYCKVKNGKLAFGGIFSVNYFDPEMVIVPQNNPKVIIKKFMVANRPFQSTEGISYINTFELEPGEDKFSISFGPTGLYNKQHLRYRYRLLGFENEWQDLAMQSNINFTNMAPGTYTFQIQARYRNNVWDDEFTSIEIVVKPPFWKRLWFIILCIIGALGMIGLAVWYRIQLLNSANRKKLQLMVESQEIERQRVAKELHDDFGARLSTLKLYLNAIKKQEQNVNELVDATSQIIDQSILELRNILLNLSPKSLQEDGLEITLKEIVRHLNKTALIKASFSYNLESEMRLSAAISCYRICLELINNTLKHAKAKKLSLSFLQRSDFVVLQYEDDGVGIEFTDLKKSGYGLNNIDNHVKIHFGKFFIDTHPNAGMSFTAEFPLNVLEK